MLEAVRVFICYRRDDTPAVAGRLYDAFVAHLGAENVFIDVCNIESTADIRQQIEMAISRCNIVVALIGPRWLAAEDTRGGRRLDYDDDLVRIEIEAALRGNLRVIPTLVQGADLPFAEDLPPTLRPLILRNAVELSDGRWRFDVDRFLSLFTSLGALDQSYNAATDTDAPADHVEVPVGNPVFVSFAHVNSSLVVPMCEEIRKRHSLWMHTDAMDGSGGWAGEIVRAIRIAPSVIVMCSAAAFESKHVKREVYLADRYSKRLLPVFLEDVAPPEDFEYFFAGAQWLKLAATPEQERPDAILRALARV